MPFGGHAQLMQNMQRAPILLQFSPGLPSWQTLASSEESLLIERGWSNFGYKEGPSRKVKVDREGAGYSLTYLLSLMLSLPTPTPHPPAPFPTVA